MIQRNPKRAATFLVLTLLLVAIAGASYAAMCVVCGQYDWPDPTGGPSEPCLSCIYGIGERSYCRDRPGNGCTTECLTWRDGCDL
jgi:hypothetical protein